MEGGHIYNISMILEKIDPELSLPTMRSDVEQQLNLIALGKAAHGDVLKYFLDMFARKFAYFTKQVNTFFISTLAYEADHHFVDRSNG